MPLLVFHVDNFVPNIIPIYNLSNGRENQLQATLYGRNSHNNRLNCSSYREYSINYSAGVKGYNYFVDYVEPQGVKA